jgi:hypothetical protein
MLPSLVEPTSVAEPGLLVPLPGWDSVVTFRLAPPKISRNAEAKIRAMYNRSVFQRGAHVVLVSDGGVGDFGAGVAVRLTGMPPRAVQSGHHFVRMPSSFSTEAAALLAAVKILEGLVGTAVLPPGGRVTIATDSLSVLQSLSAKGPWRATSICAPIWQVLLPLLPMLEEVRFCFVFGHCGCPWQNVADAAATTLLASAPSRHDVAYRPVWTVDAARALYAPHQAAAIQRLRDDAGVTRTAACPPKADGTPGPVFLQWASDLSAPCQRLLAQLRSGVCGGLGGVCHSNTVTCRICKKEGALGRGGQAVAHLFSCEGFHSGALTIASLGQPSKYADVVSFVLEFLRRSREPS